MDASAAAITGALRFTKPWRPYQQRVLDALERVAADGRIHVVAAPGSGKTTLGLELFRRIGKPALVLSPTIAIRDQWLARLADFLPPGAGTPAWAGKDLDAPRFLTSATYQSLHGGLRAGARDEAPDEPGDGAGERDDPPGEAELADAIRRLRDAGVGTLILDEAHHLRQAWWRALTRLAAALPDVTVLSLTATPPYDVTAREWRRYEELCGPIDEEIAAPELVRSGTLSPHQDFVWAVEATPDGTERLRSHDEAVDRLVADLLADDALLAAVTAHPWMASPEPDAEAVLDDPELAFALLVHAKARGAPEGAALLALLGARRASVPEPSARWWQVLLDAYLHGDSWAPAPARAGHRAALARRLRAEGLLYRRELRFDGPGPVAAELSASPAKVEACVGIHALEARVRGARLRQVFLADFIRDDDLSAGAAPDLGAWPVFRELARSADPATLPAMALLTGRLVVVHERLLPRLRALAGARGLAGGANATEALPPGFVRVAAEGSALVAPLTRLLAEGDVRVLVGTRALLGEGWDAPAVNSLVLVSYAGSFVLTNQMRGRAIRRDAADPEKVASIWHVVAVAPGVRSGWDDLDQLARRFEVFVGIGADAPALESGIERLGLPPRSAAGWAEAVAAESARRLERLPEVGARWRAAIGAGAIGRVLPAVRVVRPPRTRRLVFGHTLTRLLAVTASAFGAGFAAAMRAARPRDLGADALLVLAAACALGGLYALPGLWRAVVILARHLPVDGSVRQIAAAVLDALSEAGIVRPRGDGPGLTVEEIAPGEFAASFAGATFRDAFVFADCLAEVLAPIENPRYLVTRRGSGWLRGRVDHHAVPEPLGARKETALLFHEAWRRRLGGGDLVYTRTADGRRALLRARVRAFSATYAAFAPGARRLDRWQ